MKKILSISLLLFIPLFSFGQNNPSDSLVEKNKNILTIDATYLLRQFLNFNSISSYQDQYIIGYRRKFGHNAFRINLGGGIYNSNSVTNDTIHAQNSSSSLIFSSGYERYVHLAKRWSFYYGVDAIYEFSNRKFQQLSSDGHIFNDIASSNSFGIAPLLGIVFKINPRVDISTETSFELFYKMETAKRFYSPSTVWDTNTKSHQTEGIYFPPAGLILRIHF